jgi:membrane peptidoglycan carboxypeptidase
MNIRKEDKPPKENLIIPASIIYQDGNNFLNNNIAPPGGQPPKKPNSNNKPTDFFKTRLFKFAAYSFLSLLGFWIFLNIFITPINRILGLPKVDHLENYSPISSIEVYDKDDQFVTTLQGAEDRQVIPLSQVTTSLKQALFASEDREFFQHDGINFMGIFRAMLINIKSGKLKQGGSTITQQLVKNIFFSPKRNIPKNKF